MTDSGIEFQLLGQGLPGAEDDLEPEFDMDRMMRGDAVARADGTLAADVRPLVRLSLTVIAEGGPPPAMMTETGWRTSSAASAGSHS